MDLFSSIGGNMRKLILPSLCICFLVSASFLSAAPKGEPKNPVTYLYQFDDPKETAKEGQLFSSWDKDPKDKTQSCRISFAERGKGKALKIQYDVDSPNPAYNGIWMKNNKTDFSKFAGLTLDLRGEPEKHTSRLWVEMKSSDGGVGKVLVSGISPEWQTFELPLFLFTMHPEYASPISDFKKVSEIVLTFDDSTMTRKEGIVYFDNLGLTTAETNSFVVDDFEDGDLISSIGGGEGAWSCNPKDDSQFCEAVVAKGALRLDYDIDSVQTYDEGHPNTAYNGFYIKLNELDISKMDYLDLSLKGDPTSFVLELKALNSSYKKKISGLTSSWKTARISLKEFKAKSSLMKEIVFLFDWQSSRKEATLYIDDIGFSREAEKETEESEPSGEETE